MRSWLVSLMAVLLSFAAMPAQAGMVCEPGASVGAPKKQVPMRSGEYRRAGPAVVCQLVPKPGETISQERVERMAEACDTIGPVHLGMSRAQAKAAFGGPPWKVMSLPQGEAELHLVLDAQKRPTGYIVVQTDGAKVTALQLTAAMKGWSMPLPIAFSSIRPGDPSQQAIDVLGSPTKRCAGDEIAGEMWQWLASGITVEVVEGRVYSIRIVMSGDKGARGR